MDIDMYSHPMKMILSLLLPMSILTACQVSDKPAPSYPLQEKKIMNVSYGMDSLQKMDVYLPAGRSVDKTKSIILIHGGGWNGGNKSEFLAYIDSFKKRMPDYAIFNLNYRLVNNGHLFPTQENDVKSAVEYIMENAEDYQVHQNKLVLIGASAGAHLAMLHAYKNAEKEVQAVVNFFGPTDLITMYKKPWHQLVPYALKMITGTTPERNVDLYKQSSPINYITHSSVPTLIFHGEKDNIVHISQSNLLKERLSQQGVPHEMIVYKDGRHGWSGANLTYSFNKIEEFLNLHVK